VTRSHKVCQLIFPVQEKAQAELAWLEQQKHTWKKGEDDKMPPLKKKKRAIMMRWKVEIDEIKKLQGTHYALSVTKTDVNLILSTFILSWLALRPSA